MLVLETLISNFNVSPKTCVRHVKSLLAGCDLLVKPVGGKHR